MRITNTYNDRRKIYLFTRDINGNQKIIEDNSFHPYFFEPSPDGKYLSYDNIPLRKVVCSEPGEVAKIRSKKSYESDILYTRRYLLDKVDTIEKCPIRYLFLDIEILANEMPDVTKAQYPISCISVYDSFTKEIRTWFLGDQLFDTMKKKEEAMLYSFVQYMKETKADMILGWNFSFDYSYLHNRIEDFAAKISPISKKRYGERSFSDKEDSDGNKLFFPAGTSILDYLKLFKKVYMREGSYKLDTIAEKYLKQGKQHKEVDFSTLSETIKLRNIEDVKIMVKLEEKFKLIDYYNEVRIISKVQWEDLYYNSRIVDMMLLQEAKKDNIILPSNLDEEREDSTFQGATRDITDTGVFKNIDEYDLSSAYPSMIFNFCLDSSNIVSETKENVINIDGINFIQNEETLLPLAIRKILTLKKEVGNLKKSISHDSPEYESIARRYDGIKSIANSCFGVFGNKYFRLHDQRVTSSITYLVRDLLMYVKGEIEKQGYEVIYYDTDSLMIHTKENVETLLNQLVQDWAKKKGKSEIELSFEFKHKFNNLFILGRCHYYGRVEGKKDPEIKGIEAKRSSSSKYEAEFQEALLNKVLDETPKAEVEKWIKIEFERLTTLPLEYVAFPCKIVNKSYKNVPIFVRAYNNTKELFPKFKAEKSDTFYYIYMTSLAGKDVLAFTADHKNFIDRSLINWEEMNKRNICNKVEKIFEAVKWDTRCINDNAQTILF